MHGVLHIGLGVAGVGVGDVTTAEQLGGLEIVSEEYDEIEDGQMMVVERVTGREVVRDTGGELVVDGRGRVVEGDKDTAGEMRYVEVAGRVVENSVAGRVLVDCGSAD